MAKKSNSRNFEKEFLEKRLDTLQKFLTAVSEHEELKSSIYFSAFLKFSDQQHFALMKDSFDKAYSVTSGLKENYSKKLFEGPKPVKLSDFKTKAGNVKSRISKDLRDYSLSSEELQKTCQPAYHKLKDLCQDLVKDIEKTCDSVTKICEQLNYLQLLHKRFNDSVKEGKWELMEKMYGIMSNSMKRWGTEMRKNTKIIDEHLIKTIKYSKKEYDSMLDLIKTRNEAGQEFYKTSQALELQKDKLLMNPDPTKWEIKFEEVKMTPEEVAKNKMIAKNLMMPKENQIMNEMKNIFGYFNYMMVREMSMLANSRTKRYIRSLNSFCSEQVEVLESQSSIFTTLRTLLLEVFESLPEIKSQAISPPNKS